MNPFFVGRHLWQDPIDYGTCLGWMKSHVMHMKTGQACENLWFLEHIPVYTCGASTSPLATLPLPFPTYSMDRGGQMTFHGLGQRVIYNMIDLRKRNLNVSTYITMLQDWVINALHTLGLNAYKRHDFPGVWIQGYKIASLGVEVRSGITLHGMALNVSVDLSYFEPIHPCGLPGTVMSSLHKLGCNASMVQIDNALGQTYPF